MKTIDVFIFKIVSENLWCKNRFSYAFLQIDEFKYCSFFNSLILLDFTESARARHNFDHSNLKRTLEKLHFPKKIILHSHN